MKEIINKLTTFVLENPGNFVPEEQAFYPELAGKRIFDAPIFGIAAADDELFADAFKRPDVIHPDHLTPQDFLPGAKCVVSFFLPFSQEVKRSNYDKKDPPLKDQSLKDETYQEGLEISASPLWMHARIEGQLLLNQTAAYLVELLREAGHEAVCPLQTEKFSMIGRVKSNWSERHVAFAAGLGTFGLSKGLITSKGMAGRFGSVVTDAELEVTERPYSGPFDYCTMCGACEHRCPVNAIDAGRGCALGKDHRLCSNYLDTHNTPPHGPRQRVYYGCGKCQVKVPCMNGIPRKMEKSSH